MIMIDANIIQHLLKTLAARKRVFCSEMDFQLQLAWLMKENGYELSLEYDPGCFETNASLGIMIWKPEQVAIELKYKTAHFEMKLDRHSLRLKNHAAQDIGRYDFFRDVSRVEHIVANGKASRGFAIFLTNASGYWRSGRNGTVDEMFRMFDGRTIKSGQLRWGNRASSGTMRGREKSIDLTRDYVFSWKDYADHGTRNGVFRYLLVDVESVTAAF